MHIVFRHALIAFVATFILVGASPAPSQQQPATVRIVSAADVFLSTLTDSQRGRVQYSFSDEAQRARWSNFPTGVVPRGGINLKEMTPAQRRACMDLMAAVLSPQGLEKVNQIREADDAFKTQAKNRPPRSSGPPAGNGPPQGAAGQNPPRAPMNPDTLFGSDLYYISFLGKPSATNPWMLQFGGHHLALNVTIAGANNTLTPTLTGAQPATFKLKGRTIRPLARENDRAVALLQSLTSDQRKKAVLDYRVADLVLGPGQDAKTIVPEGLKASAMTQRQRAALEALIGEWAGIINESAAKARMAEVKADLAETWFAWSGTTSVRPGENITAYYRIQGPHLVIEYAPQKDDPADHVHTMYRDPTNDYGRVPPKK
jgi:hypothetical protein